MLKRKTLFALLSVGFISQICLAQPGPTPPNEILAGVKNRESLSKSSIVNNYGLRNIGPVVQGGRIVDIDVNPQNFHEYYVAYASGGLFKTTNNGASFQPVFDNQGTLTVGDLAVAPSNPNIIYVGTGENNSSRSSYSGNGVYKSEDGGQSWEFIGLEGIHHTGRIIVHPDNPEKVWVAAIGPLYSNSPDRGVYLSEDGGTSWAKTLFVNDSTGIIDLSIHPENPEILVAAAWERERKAWNFKGSGKGSGIYKSSDGGKTWKKINSGLPKGEEVGRIGLDFSRSNPNIIYAVHDNQKETKKEKELKKDVLTVGSFVDISKDQFLELDNKKLDDFLKSNGYPKKYTADLVKKEVREGKYTPKALADYFGDANEALFDSKILGAEVYKSNDEGENWEKVNTYDLEGVFFTYGYYFGQIDVDPHNPETVYIHGVPFLKSTDGGKTFQRADTVWNVHADHHALWINPDNPNHLLLGNDGGLYVTYDQGENWTHLNNTSVGQFYTVNVDMEKPYNVYGGLQDNGVLRGSSRSVPNRSKKWEKIFGGDGMFVSANPANSNTVITGFQFGNYYRLDLSTGKYTKITPQHDLGEPSLRFNWRTPVILSKHNPDIVYFGSQYVHRSFDEGNSWEKISDDLTYDNPQGNVPFSTIVSLVESPVKFELIYAGTDDGRIWVLKGAGTKWEEITEGLPNGLWVSSIYPSSHEQGTVFLTLNGYRFDHFDTYVYMSNDYGKSWKDISSNVKFEAANTIVQDPVNPDLLYLGTDHGTYLSLNQGMEWHLVTGLPNVACYDMVVHPRENELVIGTHGRSIYIMDVKPLQQLTQSALSRAVVAFETEKVSYSSRWGEKRYPFFKPNEPIAPVKYYLASDSGEVEIEIKNEDGELIREMEVAGDRGFNTFEWDLKSEVRKGKNKGELSYVGKGTYTITFEVEEAEDEIKVEVE